MSVKIAITVCDCSDVVHAGGEPHRITSIVELTDEQVPTNLRKHLEAIADAIEHEEKYGRPQYVYQSVTLSLVQQ